MSVVICNGHIGVPKGTFKCSKIDIEHRFLHLSSFEVLFESVLNGL